MRYTEKDLYAYMDSDRVVRVTTDDGVAHVGRCWAYSSVASEEEFGVAEPTLEVGCSVVLALSEIQKIEYVD